MEESVWLQPDKPLTVEAIQSILLQGTTVKYSPIFLHQADLRSTSWDTGEILFSEINDYAMGFGAEVPAEISRVMLLLLADFIAKHPISHGPAIIDRILEFHQFEVFPQVFTQGLLASPTAHALLPVFGRGKVYYQGYLLNAADVHDIFSWQLLTGPKHFPASINSISFLRLAVLVYSFIQFKQVLKYTQVLFSDNDSFKSSGKFFQEQADNLTSQIQIALTFSEEHTTHISGLHIQLNKLLAKFGNHIYESIADQKSEFKNHLNLKENFKINLNLLIRLLEHLSQENLILFEESTLLERSSSLNTSSGPVMPTYAALLNLEQIVALVTLLVLKPAGFMPESEKIKNTSLAAAYLNQVIAVLKEANFAELIRKTVAFMYATSKSNNPVA